MTNHQHLRERAEAVVAARDGWRDAELEPNGLKAWSKLHQALDALSGADDAETILELLAEFEAAKKDAERLRNVLADTVNAVEANRASTEAFAQNGATQYYFAFDESERTVLRQIEIARAALADGVEVGK